MAKLRSEDLDIITRIKYSCQIYPDKIGGSKPLALARRPASLPNPPRLDYQSSRAARITEPRSCPMTANLPTPKPGVLDIEAYVPGESKLPSGVKPIKLSSNETPLGPQPKGQGRLVEAARESGALSRWRRHRAAPGHRPRLRSERRSHRLRRRLRRAPEPAGARLSRPGRRGHLHRARVPGVPDRDPELRRRRPSSPRRPTTRPTSTRS